MAFFILLANAAPNTTIADRLKKANFHPRTSIIYPIKAGVTAPIAVPAAFMIPNTVPRLSSENKSANKADITGKYPYNENPKQIRISASGSGIAIITVAEVNIAAESREAAITVFLPNLSEALPKTNIPNNPAIKRIEVSIPAVSRLILLSSIR